MSENSQPEGAEEKAEAALQEACERLPTEYPWGYFHYLDGPPAAGGGVGCFAWFESEEEMLHFIVRRQVWLGPGPIGTDPADKATEVEAVINHLMVGKITPETARKEINDALKSFSQIEWWGRFGELVSVEGEFAEAIRRWYRESKQAESADSSPLTDEEEEFGRALQDYGL